MDSLVRFGTGDKTYIFNQAWQVSIDDNFGNAVPRTSRIPGVDGGFDEFGSGKAPNEIGNVTVSFWVHAGDNATITRLKREIGAMAAWGVQRLYKQVTDQNQQELFCDARINNISRPMNVLRLPHKRLKISISFQVANPGWLTQGTEAFLWGDGTAWDSGAVWGGTAVAVPLVGADNTLYVIPGGNAITWPRILLVVPSGKSATNVRVRRIVNSLVIDEVRYDATLASDERLLINARSKRITLDSVDAYNSDFTFQSADWFQLDGGLSNQIQVLMDNPTDEIEVTFKYFERYF